MSFERMLDGDVKPTENQIVKVIGKRSSLWKGIRKYLKDNYNFKSEFVFYGKKYGWTVRYRKSGKTLCSLFPEKGAFTVLVVLGNTEVE
jgi:hypothetical protein